MSPGIYYQSLAVSAFSQLNLRVIGRSTPATEFQAGRDVDTLTEAPGTPKFQEVLKAQSDSTAGPRRAPAPPRTAETVSQPELEVADSVGRLMEFWGFKRPMGRIWTLLYLSPDPLGASEIGESLKMSAGAVSMAVGELVKWGAVKKSWRPGERRDFYEAETSVGKLVQRVLRERELTLVKSFGDALDAAQRELVEHGKKPAALAWKRERLAELRRLAKLGEALLGALAAGKTVDPTPLLKLYGEP
jgi:HTH-type transcriptional regulator, glycine betaine synthesis regulator